MSGQNEQTEILREILKWTKFAGMNQVQSVLESTLDTPEKRLAYQLSDGKNGIRQIVELSRVGSFGKVQSLWKEWKKKGIGDTASVMGGGERFKRSFDLEDFGIEFPNPTTRNQSAQETTAMTAPTKTPATSAPSQRDLTAPAVETQ